MAGLWLTTDGGDWWDLVSGAHNPSAQLAISPTTGAFYIGTLGGMLKSTNGTAWSLLEGFDQGAGPTVSDGEYLYAGQQFGGGLFRIPENDPAAYESLPPTDGSGVGPFIMVHDPDHHILYASETEEAGGGGYFRMVTR
jgi:hypothetical protein